MPFRDRPDLLPFPVAQNAVLLPERRDGLHLDELVGIAEDSDTDQGARGFVGPKWRCTTSQAAARSDRSLLATYTRGLDHVVETRSGRGQRAFGDWPSPDPPGPGRRPAQRPMTGLVEGAHAGGEDTAARGLSSWLRTRTEHRLQGPPASTARRGVAPSSRQSLSHRDDRPAPQRAQTHVRTPPDEPGAPPLPWE